MGRKLGQHFLIDPYLAKRIVDFAQVERERVLEIGPGKGMLTRILSSKAEIVYAVEIDKKLADALRQKAMPNVLIINQDFLKTALSDFPDCIIVGNIPYCITTQILEKLVKERKFFKKAVFTLQKEYAERLLAIPGSPFYGSITLYMNYYFVIKKGFSIPARAFFPSPRVSSMVISLHNKELPFLIQEENFFKFINGLFRYRRKFLKNALRFYLNFTPGGLDNILGNKRPGELNFEDFKYLYDLIYNKETKNILPK
uniref:Ribosomal RNA small subunit methyltransferase A n=1 Tax=candidate division WOR-3 bacterium TaxID=2052148 RepID=A0A7C4XUS9_UNCW3